MQELGGVLRVQADFHVIGIHAGAELRFIQGQSQTSRGIICQGLLFLTFQYPELVYTVE